MKMLEVNDLTTEFSTENGTVKAVRDVSFYVDKGEVLGVVGESGSGKSQTTPNTSPLSKIGRAHV